MYRYDNPARKSAYSDRVMIPFRALEGVLYGYLRPATCNADSHLPHFHAVSGFPVVFRDKPADVIQVFDCLRGKLELVIHPSVFKRSMRR